MKREFLGNGFLFLIQLLSQHQGGFKLRGVIQQFLNIGIGLGHGRTSYRNVAAQMGVLGYRLGERAGGSRTGGGPLLKHLGQVCVGHTHHGVLRSRGGPRSTVRGQKNESRVFCSARRARGPQPLPVPAQLLVLFTRIHLVLNGDGGAARQFDHQVNAPVSPGIQLCGDAGLGSANNQGA